MRLDADAGRCLDQHRYADAVNLLQRALALNPDHADGWFNLGYALRQLRAYPEALRAYEEAIQRNLVDPEAAHVNRAAILSEYLEQIDQAERELRAAIALNPGYLPAWLNLGSLMEDMGNAEAAAKAYREASRIAPGNGRARARLSAIRVHTGEGVAAIDDLEQSLRKGVDSEEDRAELLFALGNALDAEGRYSQAFAVITEANALVAALRPAHLQYNRRAQEQLVDALIAQFAIRPDRVADDADVGMMFVCGMFRSGSTVIEQLLGRHPLIQIGGELELIPAIVHDHLLPYPSTLQNISKEKLQYIREKYLTCVRSNFPLARYVTDKRPDNFMHIGLIKTLFPSAKIIHTKRNIYDNIISAFFLNFAESINYADRIDDLVHYATQYRRLMAHWQTVFGEDMIVIDYDLMVRDPDTIMTAAFRELGLGIPEHALADACNPPIIRTPSNWKARSAVNNKSSGRWKNYAGALGPALAELGEALE
jgi:tetratricopeptide (TPR) repeat protein